MYRYVETLKKCCKTKNVTISDQFVLSSDKFSIDFIRSVTDKKIRASLKIFLAFIDIGDDIIPPHIKVEIKKEPTKFIEDVFADPYAANKKYKLHLPIYILDEIAKLLIPNFNNDKEIRINYILRKLFKLRYLTIGEFWLCMDSTYNIENKDYVLSKINYFDNKYVMLKEFTDMQKYIYDYFLLLKESNLFNVKNEIKSDKLDDLQNEIYRQCLKNNFVIITGKPGTGKSEIIGCILDSIPNTLVMAPTGCAVENIQRRFPSHKNKVYTLHCYYYANKLYDKIKDFHDAGDKCIIIDEFSMVDIFILHKVIFLLQEKQKTIDPEIANNNLKIILVGDPDQLPSIYLGRLLQDLLKTNSFLNFHLNKCYRSNAGIVKVLAHLMSHRKLVLCKEVIHANIETPGDLKKIINTDLYNYFASKENVILAPTNNSVNIFNDYIQRLNPNSVIYSNRSILKKNDKIIFLKNKPEFDIYNGTILYIDTITELGKEAIIEFKSEINSTNKKEFKCPVDEIEKHIHLCYGMTIHKSQASGFQNVFLLLDTYPEIMWDIKLVYTAISRAKDTCYISGSPKTINNSCQFLREKISYFK